MGWLWSTPVAPAQDNSKPSTTQKTQSLSETSPSQSPTSATPSKTLSRDEAAEQELKSFLSEIEADLKPAQKIYDRLPRSSPSTSTATSSSSLPQPSSSSSTTSSIAEQLLPTTMSCRTAFDAAFYCNSVGGHFNDIYRYGKLRSCSDHWGDFWFCMRTRTYAEDEKRNAIREHYRRKEGKKYGRGGVAREGGSSEDVWKSRDKMVEWGTTFVSVAEEFSGSDEDWNRAEREQRREYLKRLEETKGKKRDNV